MIGGRPKEPETLVLLPFGQCDQRGGRFPLRADGAAPIIVASRRHGLTDGSDFVARTARGDHIACAGSPNRSRVMHERFGVPKPIPREPGWLDLQCGSGSPIAPFESPARWRC